MLSPSVPEALDALAVTGPSPDLQVDAEAGVGFESLERMLDEGCAAAERLPHAAQRRRALMQHVLHSRDRILALMNDDEADRIGAAERAHQLALMRHGTARWLAMVRRIRFRERWRVARRDFRVEPCGTYPFRDADHGELALQSVQGDASAFADVEPFTCHRVSRRVRAATTLRWLLPRRLTAADLRAASERPLIGQWGLFARVAIPAGTCLGVYGGQLLDDVDLFLLEDDRYLISASDELGQVAINGENLPSLMNTLFELDEQGAVTGHPPSGYNVVPETFRVTLRHGWHACIRAFRAADDIPAGHELRWNYGLRAGLG
jgi:hypothetical protein